MDPWGKPYKIVMGKFRKQAPPVNETMNIDLLSSVLEYLFPSRINRHPAITPRIDDHFDEITKQR